MVEIIVAVTIVFGCTMLTMKRFQSALLAFFNNGHLIRKIFKLSGDLELLSSVFRRVLPNKCMTGSLFLIV